MNEVSGQIFQPVENSSGAVPFECGLRFRLSHPQTAWAAHTYPKIMRKPSYLPPPGDEVSGLDSKRKNGLCVLEMLAVPFKALTNLVPRSPTVSVKQSEVWVQD